MKKIAIVLNTSWNIYNFRLNLARALSDNGYEVVLIAPYDKYSDLLKQEFEYHDIQINNKGANPIEDFKTFLHFFQIYREVKPDIILSYTIKPNIYGTLAASLLSIKTINNISGLGTVFIKKNYLTKIVKLLYRYSFSKASKIFFQNRDDFELFIQKGLIQPDKCDILPGSGIDTVKFEPMEEKKNDGIFRFLLVARLLKDKGVFEYVDAVRRLKKRFENVEFQILGAIDAVNLTAVSKKALNRWIEEEVITYLGMTDDVRSYIANSDCVVLPSYREGTPRTLLEASSMAKSIITTNVPGCKDVIEDGRTGLLCEVKNDFDLEEKMEQMLNLSEDERKNMGLRGREKMIKEYDEQIVIDRYLKAISELLQKF